MAGVIDTHHSRDNQQGASPVIERGYADVVAKGENVGAKDDKGSNELVLFGCDGIEDGSAGQGIQGDSAEIGLTGGNEHQ